MKQFLVTLLLGLCAVSPCFAQSTTFRPETGDVEIPCIDVWDSRQVVGVYTTYKARLTVTGRHREFALTQIEPMLYGDYCSGSFDVATNLYTDIVNIYDDSYDVTLRRDAANLFTVESFAHRGAATTSVWVARNGANTVYLAGTIHILRSSDYPLPRAFTEAYANASALYFEIDMDDPGETGENLTQEQILQLLADPQGRTLRQVLTPENYAALETYMRRERLSIEATNSWSAQILINALGRRELEINGGFSADGVDNYFASRAKQDHKAIHGLETSALQNNVLHTMNEGYENEVVESFLHDVASRQMFPLVDRMIATWRSGDTTAIYWGSIVPMRDYAYDDYLILHANRNNSWIPQIEAMLQTPATEMVVVGVAHMAGEDGLVSLLRQRGYSVEKY